ncbi:hypothetical protein [Shewanella algae]|uniref:hypothetical protein n=1 Tax=Shewanella TaxID=22 RepID=UPI002723B0E9|nr:hypothetical protein [Shewanella algae]MDO8254818.1 hypothetical protein [Shewanella algae]
MKWNNLEGLVALFLFLAGWIFAQFVSLNQSVLKSIESLAVIGASISAIIAAYVGIKAYYSWRKPEQYGEVKSILSLIHDEISGLVDIISESQKLIYRIESAEPEKISECKYNFFEFYGKFLTLRAINTIKINNIIPIDSGDGIAIYNHLSSVFNILEGVSDEISELEVRDVSSEKLEIIRSGYEKLFIAINEEVKCTEIIRRRLERI